MSVAGVSLSPGHTEVKKEGMDGWTGVNVCSRSSHPEPAATPPGLLSLLRRTNSWDRSSRSCREKCRNDEEGEQAQSESSLTR